MTGPLARQRKVLATLRRGFWAVTRYRDVRTVGRDAATFSSTPTIMIPDSAGAIDDNCLTTEFKAAAAKIGEISVLASKKDEVLSAAFPLGNLVAGIIVAGRDASHFKKVERASSQGRRHLPVSC
jgi:hypothetical protein